MVIKVVFSIPDSVPFQVCKLSDPGINKCMKSAIQSALPLLRDGLPEYEIAPIEPIVIPEWIVPARPPLNYEQKHKNWIIHNFAGSTVKDAQIHFNNADFFLTIIAHNPEISARLEYQYDNAILDGIDVSSTGFFSYTYNGVELQIDFHGKIEKQIRFTEAKLRIISIEKFNSKFESNETEKIKVMVNYYNENAQYLVATEKRGYEMSYANALMAIANNVFSKFPAEKLFIS